jgi:hypothetical protein
MATGFAHRRDTGSGASDRWIKGCVGWLLVTKGDDATCRGLVEARGGKCSQGLTSHGLSTGSLSVKWAAWTKSSTAPPSGSSTGRNSSRSQARSAAR